MELTCAECGRRIARRSGSGPWRHRARGAVAACDLDSDHVAVPDWDAIGATPCAACGALAIWVPSGGRRHVDVGIDADHPPA